MGRARQTKPNPKAPEPQGRKLPEHCRGAFGVHCWPAPGLWPLSERFPPPSLSFLICVFFIHSTNVYWALPPATLRGGLAEEAALGC